ncbi:MAG: hypothetical protein RL336_177 [Pseudomonadota bacterium]|jgi:uroporphyrin-3 C-methyltransferase
MTDSSNKDDQAAPPKADALGKPANKKAAVATPSPKKEAPKAEQKTATSRAWFAGSMAFVALAVALGGGYLGYQQTLFFNEELKQQTQQLRDLSAQIQQSHTRLETLSQQWQKSTQASAGLSRQVSGLTDIVANNQRRIDEVAGTERSDWQLAEAEYLLRLANQRLLMSGEVRGSKALLQAADNVLVAVDDVALLPVRQAIAKDLASLNRADSLDIEGLYLRVGALASQLDYLELRSAKHWVAEARDSQPKAANAEGLLGGWQKAWAALSELVVIRDSGQRALPQMSDVEIAQLKQGLHFLVEQAKYAVLSGKQPLYASAIANLQGWVLDYYDAEARATAAFLSELQLLSDAQVSQSWPDISGSLQALKLVMRDRMGLPARDSALQSSPGEGK